VCRGVVIGRVESEVRPKGGAEALPRGLCQPD